MSKYDFELDLNSENSLSLIINMIKPNSKILEFGPAHGRLTKYLKESMNCIVDIVEIDEEAGKEAEIYANKSFLGENLGDIEQYLWIEDIKDERYDYIVFADVLEHLYDPYKVLIKCKKLLKDNGSILLSLPNIAHNSIIIDLINDEFKYNETGLLDNTHIRFFTYKSLIRMLEKIGLVAIKEKATYRRVGENEIINSYSDINKEISKQLKQRDKGNIYQFIFEVKKKEYYLREAPIKSVNLDRLSSYELVVYIKDKNTESYNENNTIRKSIYSNKINQIIDLDKDKVVNEIRIDPITSNCIIDELSIYTIIENSKIELPIIYTNCDVEYKSKYFFRTEDPQIYVNLSDINIERIYIEFILIDYDSKSIDTTIDLVETINLDKEYSIHKLEHKLKEDIEIQMNNIIEKNKTISKKDIYINKIETEISLLKKEINNKKMYIENLENTNEQFMNEIIQIKNSKIWKMVILIKKYIKLLNIKKI